LTYQHGIRLTNARNQINFQLRTGGIREMKKLVIIAFVIFAAGYVALMIQYF